MSTLDTLHGAETAKGVTPKNTLEALKAYNTPQITNAVATYPKSDTCLGLYHPTKTNWYCDTSVKAMFPEKGRTVGYAVTCVFGEHDPNFNRLSWCDVLDAIEASPKPCILVIKHEFPEPKNKVGLVGGNMATHMTTLGCSGVLCDGPARDLDEIRPLEDFQMLCTGTCAGHGELGVYAINTPVSVAGMDVAPGEIVHMDENGATKFPADVLQAVSTNCAKLQAMEDKQLAQIRRAKSSAEIREILMGDKYGDNPSKKGKTSNK